MIEGQPIEVQAPRLDATESFRSPERNRYKWVALSVTTVGVVLATIDSSIMLIAMPDIFRGINLDPLIPSNSFYLLWMILSFLVVSSVLVVSLGRLGDIFGRVRMYNLGFVIYTISSLVLTVDWLTGQAGASYLIVGRVFQGIGAAFLVANSAAILTDAFPSNSGGSRSASTMWRASAACLSAWSLAVSWRRSIGGSFSSSLSPLAPSAPFGRTSNCGSLDHIAARPSTGWVTSRSRPG